MEGILFKEDLWNVFKLWFYRRPSTVGLLSIEDQKKIFLSVELLSMGDVYMFYQTIPQNPQKVFYVQKIYRSTYIYKSSSIFGRPIEGLLSIKIKQKTCRSVPIERLLSAGDIQNLQKTFGGSCCYRGAMKGIPSIEDL